jgi:AcrR family transcriptional regulator
MSKVDTKAFITEISFKLFLDKGYNQTSMADLVRATKLSKGAFYHYFKNKEELYQEVLNRYFIAYYKNIDWNAVKKMSVAEIKIMTEQFYKSFIPEILSLTPKGMSRYFILFFEAYENYPIFKNEVRTFYEQLKTILVRQLEKEGIKNPISEATKLISKYEGLIFLLAVFPEQNIHDLLK